MAPPGLIKAIEQCWPASDRQRCCVHRARNLCASCPNASANGSSMPTGKRSMTQSTPTTPSNDCRRWSTSSTTAASCPRPNAWPTISTRAWCTCATRHRRRWRSTNLLERSLGEVKRRTKVIGRFHGEDSCLTLIGAVLDLLITHETNGNRFTELERQRLKSIRYGRRLARRPRHRRRVIRCAAVRRGALAGRRERASGVVGAARLRDPRGRRTRSVRGRDEGTTACQGASERAC